MPVVHIRSNDGTLQDVLAIPVGEAGGASQEELEEALAELAEQKAITRSIVDGTIVEFVDYEITEIGGDALRSRTKLEKVVVPNVYSLRASCFSACTSLKRAEFGNLTTFRGIAETSFKSCSSLEALIIRGQTRCVLQSTNAFTDSGIAAGTGYVYVPDNLVESYKTATNWVTYASQIKPISELPEEG